MQRLLWVLLLLAGLDAVLGMGWPNKNNVTLVVPGNKASVAGKIANVHMRVAEAVWGVNITAEYIDTAVPGATAYSLVNQGNPDPYRLTLLEIPTAIAEASLLPLPNFTLSDLNPIYIDTFNPVLVVISTAANIGNWSQFVSYCVGRRNCTLTGDGKWSAEYLTYMKLSREAVFRDFLHYAPDSNGETRQARILDGTCKCCICSHAVRLL